MTQQRKSKGKRRRRQAESQPPEQSTATQDETQEGQEDVPEASQEQPGASQELPPPSQPQTQDSQGSSQPRQRKRKEGPKLANIEFPDAVLDALFAFMEDNPVLWSNDKDYAFQKKQRREEAWERLVAHLKEKFPEHDPEDLSCKSNISF